MYNNRATLDEAMSYLIERIMEISEIHIRDISTPLNFNELPNSEETDGLIEIDGDMKLSNGHISYSSPPQNRKMNDCC